MTPVLSLCFLFCSVVAVAHSLPSDDEIFGAIYSGHYDAQHKKVIYRCPQEEKGDFNSCVFKGDSVGQPELLFATALRQNKRRSFYTLTDVTGPGNGCRACAPKLGFGLFQWKNRHWVLVSKSTDIRFGADGEPAHADFLQIGPSRYGYMLTVGDMHGGYATTEAMLITDQSGRWTKVWTEMLDEDNEGAYDPTGEGSRIHADAPYSFVYVPDQPYYDLRLIVKGNGYGNGDSVKDRSGVFTYRFTNGEFRLFLPK